MKIEYLYWEDCPSHEEGLARFKEVMAEEGVDADISPVLVETEDLAQKLLFVGSPTIRINNVDIDPTSESEMGMYRLTCRIYRHEDGRISPLPSKETIRRALIDHCKNQNEKCKVKKI